MIYIYIYTYAYIHIHNIQAAVWDEMAGVMSRAFPMLGTATSLLSQSVV